MRSPTVPFRVLGAEKVRLVELVWRKVAVEVGPGTIRVRVLEHGGLLLDATSEEVVVDVKHGKGSRAMIWMYRVPFSPGHPTLAVAVGLLPWRSFRLKNGFRSAGFQLVSVRPWNRPQPGYGGGLTI
jgi:hypothetical protein